MTIEARPAQENSRLISSVPLLFDQLETVTERLRKGRAALFFDYDGTLTPIVNDPSQALLDGRTRELLAELAQRIPIAIVSGRDVEALKGFIQLEGIYYAGSHGFEIVGPSCDIRPDVSTAKPVIDSATKAFTLAAERFPGTTVERKPYSVAFHWRQAQLVHLPAILAEVEQVLRAHPELRRRDGKKVAELVINLDRDKGKALTWLLEALGKTSEIDLPIYVGDDLTDEDAFGTVQRNGGWAIVVQGEEDRPTRAEYALRDVGEVKKLLEMVASL